MAIKQAIALALVGIAGGGFGQQARAIEATTTKASSKEAATVQAGSGADTRRLTWVGWGTSLAIGDPVGQTHASADCQQHEARAWSELMAHRVGAEMQQAFADELRSRRSRAGSNAAPLQVSAVLSSFVQNLCSAGQGSWHGSFHVQVAWKVEQVGSGRVLYQGTTKGSFATALATERPPAYAVRDAFAMATRNLLADRRFVAALQPSGSRAITVVAQQ